MLGVGGINQSLYLSISRALNNATKNISDSIKRLDTGSRFANSTDQPVLQSFVNRLDAQLRGINQAQLNVDMATGFLNKADSTLQVMSDIASSLKDLAVQASSDSLSSSDRSLLEEQAQGLMDQFSSLSTHAEMNQIHLLDGTFGTHTVQNGPNSGDNFNFTIGDARAVTLGRLAIYSGAQGSITNAIDGGNDRLIINNVEITASTSDGYSTKYSDRSALAISSAINSKTSDSGVTAEALTTQRTLYIDNFSSSYTGTFSNGDFQINGLDVTGTISDISGLVSAINDHSSTTGVSASTDANGNITLKATDGRNIELAISNSSTNNVYDIFNVSGNTNNDLFSVVASTNLSLGSDGTAIGAVQIFSSDRIYISGGSAASTTIGISVGTKEYAGGTQFAALNFSTASSASQAVKVLQSTIDDISTLRSNIDAVHSRLDYSSTSLLQSSIVLDNTKTAIGGTDFAMEIASLAMAQFLQDATLASFAQANVSASSAANLLSSLNGLYRG